jgi:anti-sigma-K factor RskA
VDVTSNEVARDYLLGRLTESDSESLENRILEDEEVFLAIRGVEDDLFDDYARGTLSEADRSAFLERYRDSKRVTFARALAQRGPNVVVMPRRRWMGWTAAAAAAVAIVVTALVLRSPRPSSPVPGIAPAARSVAVMITLGTSRSASEAKQIEIARDVAMVHLSVRLNPQDRFDAYSMELHSRGVVWSAQNLQSKNEAGELIVSADVPARILATGSYELGVRGGDETLGFAALEVHRAP